ncbi:plasmid partition protein ParG [Nostoc sp. FACHB-145]|uniref:plasmid partition protein ParG n=1 Tax=Nostoc sp. FACHB-145 TaxID=2692836 RepID=UPI001682085B|nr:plasmid partition protein ParG [Nostoc sp. FACHB-145]
MAKPEDTVKLIISKELKIRFKSLCVQSETDMSSVAKELIATWCDEQERKLTEQKNK